MVFFYLNDARCYSRQERFPLPGYHAIVSVGYAYLHIWPLPHESFLYLNPDENHYFQRTTERLLYFEAPYSDTSELFLRYFSLCKPITGCHMSIPVLIPDYIIEFCY